MKLLVFLFIGFLGVLGVWKSMDLDTGTSDSKTLNLSINNHIKSFDPAVAFNDDSLRVIGQSLETLYQYHYLKRPYEVIPALADGMPRVSKDGKTYTIKLKKHIKYKSSLKELKNREVKAQDFINQIKRLAFTPLNSTGAWLFKGKIKGFDEFSKIVGTDYKKMLTTPMEGLKALDDHTLKIELNRAEPNMLYFLSMIFTTPVPEELIKKFNNDLSGVLVGTGAFYLKTSSEEKLVFEKNESFRKEHYPSAGDRYANTQSLLNSSLERLPFLDRVIFHVINDEGKKWERFLNKELDILSVPKKFLATITEPRSSLKEEMDRKGIKIKHFSSISSRWLGFNMQDPVIGKNLNLRKAIAHSIDFDRYLYVMSNNTNLKANSIYNPSIPGYNPSNQLSYKYDLEKAKEFLKLAGFEPGELTITYTTRGKQDIHFIEAEFIKSQLEKLGINVKVETVSFSEFLKRGRAGKLQFFTDNWIYDYPDAENIIQLLIGSNSPGVNKSAYKHPFVDSLYSKLAKTSIKQKRVELMEQVERQVDKDLPWIMLMFESSYILHHSNVKNFRRSYFIRNHLKYLKKE
ncbi:MAG: hypothetical protein CME64_05440 [Halobacteriovoraceae bacterium]|nr:hypothetical protein [Halobacteriovoraceae bacterium]|tara:strand:+ start:252524 stop:254245 length:1722 start_codon:yes stop_codon:yes gene_type:complete